MRNDPCREHRFPCIAQTEQNGAPEIAVAKQIGHDGCRHGADNDRPSRLRPESDQRAGGHPCGRPENGDPLGLGQQRKAKPRRDEIDDADRDREPDRANPPRQADAGGQLMPKLGWSCHPALLPRMVPFSTRHA